MKELIKEVMIFCLMLACIYFMVQIQSLKQQNTAIITALEQSVVIHEGIVTILKSNQEDINRLKGIK